MRWVVGRLRTGRRGRGCPLAGMCESRKMPGWSPSTGSGQALAFPGCLAVRGMSPAVPGCPLTAAGCESVAVRGK
jgi:hypothetical protein